MGTEFEVDNNGVMTLGTQGSDPGSPSEGDIWYNSTDKKLRYYDGTDVKNTGSGLWKIYPLLDLEASVNGVSQTDTASDTVSELIVHTTTNVNNYTITANLYEDSSDYSTDPRYLPGPTTALRTFFTHDSSPGAGQYSQWTGDLAFSNWLIPFETIGANDGNDSSSVKMELTLFNESDVQIGSTIQVFDTGATDGNGTLGGYDNPLRRVIGLLRIFKWTGTNEWILKHGFQSGGNDSWAVGPTNSKTLLFGTDATTKVKLRCRMTKTQNAYDWGTTTFLTLMVPGDE